MIKEAIKTAMDKCIPSKLTSSRYTVPWFGREQRRMCRTKQHRYKKAKRTGNSKRWSDYSEISNKLKKNLRHTRNTYINNNLNEIFKGNRKRFRKFVKKITHEDVGIPDLKVNIIISDSK